MLIYQLSINTYNYYLFLTLLHSGSRAITIGLCRPQNLNTGTLYSMSTSGWMEAPNFLEWFTKLFFPAVEEMVQTGPVVLFLDGHQSHAALPLIELAKDHGVILYALPPHTTHLLQPLDVGVFAPLKQVWSQVLKKYKMETIGTKVTKEVFPSLVAKMWPQVLLS